MEEDEVTLGRRRTVRSRAEGWEQEHGYAEALGLESFLACRVPGTDVTLGLSRRLFDACAALYQEDREIAAQTPGLRAEDQLVITASDHEIEERARLARERYREREHDARERVNARLRGAVDETVDGYWFDVLSDEQPRLALAPTALEATTPETYLAIDPGDVFRRWP
nr:hypothetical protein OG781_41665 [Streptomyces sp. NBC_00830]